MASERTLDKKIQTRVLDVSLLRWSSKTRGIQQSTNSICSISFSQNAMTLERLLHYFSKPKNILQNLRKQHNLWDPSGCNVLMNSDFKLLKKTYDATTSSTTILFLSLDPTWHVLGKAGLLPGLAQRQAVQAWQEEEIRDLPSSPAPLVPRIHGCLSQAFLSKENAPSVRSGNLFFKCTHSLAIIKKSKK